MSPTRPPLTVIMPAYDEADCLPRTVAELREHVLDRVEGAELLVIDDGSTDGTPEVLERLAADDRRLRVVRQENAGHGPALRRGMETAEGERFFLVDSDAEVALDDFHDHWTEAIRRDAVVLGVRRRRSDAWPRRVLTRIVRWTLRLLFRTRLSDANAPYKILRRTDWERARSSIPPDTLAPSLFLAVFLDLQDDVEVVQRTVRHRVRAAGSSSLNWRRLLDFCSRAFGQLLRFRRRLR